MTLDKGTGEKYHANWPFLRFSVFFFQFSNAMCIHLMIYETIEWSCLPTRSSSLLLLSQPTLSSYFLNLNFSSTLFFFSLLFTHSPQPSSFLYFFLIPLSSFFFSLLLKPLLQQRVLALVKLVLGRRTEGSTLVKTFIVGDQMGRTLVSVKKWHVMRIQVALRSWVSTVWQREGGKTYEWQDIRTQQCLS